MTASRANRTSTVAGEVLTEFASMPHDDNIARQLAHSAIDMLELLSYLEERLTPIKLLRRTQLAGHAVDGLEYIESSARSRILRFIAVNPGDDVILRWGQMDQESTREQRTKSTLNITIGRAAHSGVEYMVYPARRHTAISSFVHGDVGAGSQSFSINHRTTTIPPGERQTLLSITDEARSELRRLYKEHVQVHDMPVEDVRHEWMAPAESLASTNLRGMLKLDGREDLRS